MKYAEGNADELKTKFWKAMADSPFVFLELDGQPDTAVPMTAQLDKDANSSVWFFTHKHSDFAKLGLSYTVAGETNLIGYHAEGNYKNATGETYAIMGMKLWAEYLDGIAVVTVGTSNTEPAVAASESTGRE